MLGILPLQDVFKFQGGIYRIIEHHVPSFQIHLPQQMRAAAPAEG